MYKDYQLHITKITKKDYKKCHEKYWSLSEKEKEKSNNISMKDIKTSLKTENKNWLSIEKNTKYRKIKIPHK